MTETAKLLAEFKASRVSYARHTQQMEQGYGSHTPMTEGHVVRQSSTHFLETQEDANDA